VVSSFRLRGSSVAEVVVVAVTIKLGTNITAQFLRQQFGRAAEDLSTATQRLASGQRIVKPSDDPAGLAIAERLTTDARIYTQGVRNLNQGISAISIAEGAMTEMASLLDRIDELAKQSQNGTLTQNQRNVLQQEVTALQSEWNRIIESTKYNGMQLLTGTDTRLVLQGMDGTSGTLAVQFGEEQLAGGLAGYAGGTTRVSTDSSGNESAGTAFTFPINMIAISADGRYVAFNSTANNLVAGDTNGQQDAFIKDTLTGIVTRVSTDSAGSQATGGSSYVRAISADGRYVAFDSAASNLVASDTNVRRDVFVKDTATGITTRVSTDSAGNQVSGAGSYVTAISADGRYVVFRSGDANLVVGDTNGQVDIFVKDTMTGVTTRVSTDSSGLQSTGGGADFGSISADGRYVTFQSSATNLVAGDTNGQQDVFMKDTLTGTTIRISTDSYGNQAAGDSLNGLISADGRYVMFNSTASNLVAGDTNGNTDVFIKDIVTGLTTVVSTASEGTLGNNQSQGRAISADGRYAIILSAATNLVSGDTNARFDYFIKDTATGNTTRINTDSAGGQTTGNVNPFYSAAISADGRYVAFDSSASNLVTGDTNGQRDAFLKDLTKTGVNQLSGLIVSNRVSAGVTLTLTARAREELTAYRASLGTSLTRINSFVNTLSGATINLQEAAARIKEADVAEEASRLMAARMRQEVAANLLRQTNLQPSLALLLLKG
jgi:flagellin-like hook-associated protein FlgL